MTDNYYSWLKFLNDYLKLDQTLLSIQQNIENSPYLVECLRHMNLSVEYFFSPMAKLRPGLKVESSGFSLTFL